jgi:hypothetical protein
MSKRDNLNTQRVYEYNDSVRVEEENRKPLEQFYAKVSVSGFVKETDPTKQKSEIDGYITLKSGKTIAVEEKIHCVNCAFTTELFVELEVYWNHSGELKCFGWGLSEQNSDMFVDYCSVTKQYFCYKTKPLFEQIRAWYQENSFPHGSYYPKTVLNKSTTFRNIKIPRKHVEQHLITSGRIS